MKKTMTKIGFAIFLFILSTRWAAAQPYPVIISTSIIPPANPYFNQMLSGASGRINVQLIYNGPTPPGTVPRPVNVKVIGTIECISPNPFTISLNPAYIPLQPVQLYNGQPAQLTASMLMQTFGNFADNNLLFTGTSSATIKNGANVKLPEGMYKLCFVAYSFQNATNGLPVVLSDPNSGCTVFSVCYKAGAPQFVTPVNGVSITSGIGTVNMNSPVAFTWTPPSITCGIMPGGITYDFEIRQLLQGQTVTDAINNPYVFQKKGLPATTFIIDTNLYKNILVQGNQYVIRVKANNNITGQSAVEIDNQGYSRIEAFQYGTAGTSAAGKLAADNPPPVPAPTGPAAAYVSQASCPNTPVVNTTPIGNFNPNGQQLSIDGFTLFVDQATTNKDGSFAGAGYIVWHPLSADLHLKVIFDTIRINTDKVVYGGAVRTFTDQSNQQWSPFGNTDPITMLTTQGNASYAGLSDRLAFNSHQINSGPATTEMDFPLGYNTSIGGTPATLAIMGILFQPSCTNMDVLMAVSLPDMDGWLPLAATGLQISPDKILQPVATVLYLPSAITQKTGGTDFTFETKPSSQGNIDTAGATYVRWNGPAGLDRIVVNAAVRYTDYSSVVAMDRSHQPTSNPFSLQAHFTFADWNDWIATIVPDSGVEMVALPGFPVSASGGYLDHSVTSNPQGLAFPAGYTGETGTGWQGLYLSSPTLSMPVGFRSTQANGLITFPLDQFILDQSGVTAGVTADNVLPINQGSISGWPFSITHLSIQVVQGMVQNGMVMDGGLQIPLSTDPIPYSCNLHGGANNAVTYQFTVTAAGNYNVGMWAATMTLDPNSSFTIVQSKDTFVINATLNGSVSVSTVAITALPKLDIKGLTFQNMKLTNDDKTTHQFSFAAGAWSFNGISLSGLSADIGNTGGSSQSSAAGFKLGLTTFKPYIQMSGQPNTNMEVDMGITLGASVELDVSAFKIGGSAIMDIFGIVHFPAGGTPQIDPHPHVNLDSIGIVFKGGNVLSINGGLKLYREDATYGDGAKGSLSVTILDKISVTAGAIFGKILGNSGYNYWGIAAQVYWSQGILFPPGISFNGLGGGFHYNMTIGNINPATETDPNTLIGMLVPKSGDLGFDAQAILAYIKPNVFCFKPTIMMDFTTKGGLVDVKIEGPGEILSSNPPNGAGIVSVLASGALTLVPDKNFNFTLIVKGSLNQGNYSNLNNATQISDSSAGVAGGSSTPAVDSVPKNPVKGTGNISASIGVNIPIVMNVGALGNYLNVGTPAPPFTAFTSGALNSMVTVQLGFDAKIVKVTAVGYAYLDIGTDLPAAPYIPPALQNATTQGGSSAAAGIESSFSNMIQSLVDANTLNNAPTGTVSDPGFMFGAGLHLDANLDLVVVAADASLDIGFASMLEHFDPSEVIKSGCSASGVIGFNNWYAMAMMYANMTLDLKGLGVKIASVNAGAILTAGLPNPTWASGDVYLSVSVLKQSYTGDAHFNLGTPCVIVKDYLTGKTFIQDFGPRQLNGQSPSDVYTIPYVVGTLPLNQDYTAVLSNGELRTYQFRVDQFDVITSKGTALSGNLTASGQDRFDLMHDEPLCGNATYTAHIRIRAYQMQNGQAIDPIGPDGKSEQVMQDTTFTFRTAPRPGMIELRNVVYSYPMDGQRYLLKSEFSGKGEVVVGSDIGYLMSNSQQDDCSNPGATTAGGATGGSNTGNPKEQQVTLSQLTQAATMVMKFISATGDTLQSPFTYQFNSGNKRGALSFVLPAGLKNNAKYSMQAWVTPPPLKPDLTPAATPGRNPATAKTGAVVAKVNATLPKASNNEMNAQVTNTGLNESLLAAANGPHCIFTAYFGTSQFNSFGDKMRGYGTWKTQPEFPLTSEIPLYTDAAGQEPFDLWEVEGYSSPCNTNGYTQPAFDPLFAAVVPGDNALQNDIDAQNMYAHLLSLAAYAAIDMGVPEVRANLWWMPDNSVSLQNMPYQPALTAPGTAGLLTAASSRPSNGITPVVAPAAPWDSKYLVHNGIYGLPPSAPVANPGLATAGANATAGHYNYSSAPTVPLSNFKIQAKPGLDWLRDSYIKADYDLMERFANTVMENKTLINALNNTYDQTAPYESLLNQSGTVQVTGPYGSIGLRADRLTKGADLQQFYTLMSQIQSIPFTPFPPTASRPLKLSYSYSLCKSCGLAGSTFASSFSYAADQIPTAEKLSKQPAPAINHLKN